MTRPLRTLLLSATALGALATATAAAPPTLPPSDGATAGMASMHATGTTQMHETLAAQGIDVDAMQAGCPMLTDASMATLHRSGGHRPQPPPEDRGGDRR